MKQTFLQSGGEIMKRAICAFLVVIIVLSISACGKDKTATSKKNHNWIEEGNTSNNIANIDIFTTVCEDDELKLEINPDTTDIRVTVKKTGYSWVSRNTSTSDSEQYPIISLAYEDSKGTADIMNSTVHSVNKGQYKIDNLDNGVKILYTIGNVPKKYRYPSSLSVERYEHFYKLADENTQTLLDLCYSKIVLEDYLFDEELANEMLSNYPNLKNGPVYAVYEETMNDSLKLELTDALTAIGYTDKDYEADNPNKNEISNDKPLFNVSVEYTLENGELLVRIPMEEIDMSDGCKLEVLEVLKCFSGGNYSDGYFLLPDGSGSIMNFYNGKGTSGKYTTSVYGEDFSVKKDAQIIDYSNAPLPVYGCKEGNNAYFVIIEDSDCVASINAVTGNKTLIPRVWSDFVIQQKDVMVSDTLSSSDAGYTMSVHQNQIYDGDIRLRYSFFTDDKANYSAMAQYCGEKLFAERNYNSNGYPATIKMIGAIDITRKLCGVEYSSHEVLTDINQASAISKELISEGIDALNVRYSGWFAGGYRHGLVNSLKVRKDLGGLDELIKWADDEEKINVYPEADLQYAWKNDCGILGLSDKQIITMLNKEDGILKSFHPALYNKVNTSESRYILKPSVISSGFKQLEAFCDENGFKGFAVRSVGTDLNSDYSKFNEISRQKAGISLNQNVKKASEKNSVMISGANYIASKYADILIDIPLRSDREILTDYSVPFLQMVISGRVSYFGESVNIDNSEKIDLLRFIECGAAPSYTITSKVTNEADIDTYSFLYASEYAVQKEKIIETYKYLKTAVNGLYGNKIIKHERLKRNVFKTIFEDGEAVVVNYNESEVEYSGKKISPFGYLRIKEGES